MPQKSVILKIKFIAAFFCIYVFWGGTFLARRSAIETIPPFFMAGCQFALAGILMAVLAVMSGSPRPSGKDVLQAALPGFLILSCGTGLLAWSQQTVSSGIAALLTASVPLWMVLLENLKKRTGFSLRSSAGLAAGFLGIAALVLPRPGSMDTVDGAGAFVLLAAAFLWSAGSLLCRDRGGHLSSRVWLSLQLLWGGGILLLASFLSGAHREFDAAKVTFYSAAAFGYLVLFGGVAGFIAYDWLLRRASASAVATHAFVNPLIAVVLGWAFAGEKLGLSSAAAASLILLSVALLIPGGNQGTLDECSGKSRISA